MIKVESMSYYILFSTSVPVSSLPELVHKTKMDLKDSKLHSTIVGHVGDGNFHALILFDPSQELEAVSGAVHRLVYRAIALDGTCVYLETVVRAKSTLIFVLKVLESMEWVSVKRNI